ncbi:hypothetical protein [Capillimicrobium parvum]|uniref:hypothetical protein n=1 Tax=Capillimicrobium parvum TaxID=2884022 RepID=UPI00216B32C7|nr:hypothetical protein [Capillimicrobium parvum]
MTAHDVIREVFDPSGARVVLPGRVWREKVLRGHPELELHVDAMLRAVRSPAHVEADPVFEERRR